MITLSSSSFLQSSLLYIFTQGEWHFIIMSMKFLALVEICKDWGHWILVRINRSSTFVAYHLYLSPVVLYVRCLMFGKNNVCCGFVVYGLLYVEESSFYAYLLESCYHKWILNFVKSFLMHLLRQSCGFYFQIANMVYWWIFRHWTILASLR